MKQDNFDRMPWDKVEVVIGGSYVGIRVTLPAKTTVIAGANPKGSRFNPSLGIQQNFGIRQTIQSRFGFKWLIRRLTEEDELREIALAKVGLNTTRSEITFTLNVNFIF